MNSEKLLKQIENNVKNCKKCRLSGLAKNPVPGEGDINARIVFIGEAPGAHEDASGKPFVGRAGKLLEKLLEKINLTREQVWIGNIIKHRPPKNRDPLPDEIAACKGYLHMQLEALQPALIVTLGRYAMNYFYPEGKISRDRGRLIIVGGNNIYPVYHPAAGLRNSSMLLGLKEDFLRIPEVLRRIEEGKLPQESKKTSDDGQLSLF